MFETVVVTIELLLALLTIEAAVLALCFVIAGILWLCGVK